MNVAVLCVQKGSVYSEFPGLDLFDAERDAFTFTGPAPVVAHPPCRLFGKLSHFVKPGEGSREIELGLFCAEKVLENGGVLEHPENSRLWEIAGLPRPGLRDARGFTLSVPQYWFGHLGQKATWFFIAGLEPRDLPEIPLRLIAPDCRRVEFLSHRQREATPRAAAEWLIETARRSACVAA